MKNTEFYYAAFSVRLLHSRVPSLVDVEMRRPGSTRKGDCPAVKLITKRILKKEKPYQTMQGMIWQQHEDNDWLAGLSIEVPHDRIGR